MKYSKLVYIILILTICAFTSGCNSILESKKPSVYYYTSLFSKYINEETSSFSSTVLDTNFYKEKTLTTDNKTTIKDFIKNMHRENFISKPKDLPQKPAYKMYFTFKNDKYVINVYNERYLSIYPWDGKYTEDFIDMHDIPISCNVYSLCKFLIPR